MLPKKWALGARLPAVFGGNDLPRKLVSKKMGAPLGGVWGLVRSTWRARSGGYCGNDLLSKLVCQKKNGRSA